MNNVIRITYLYAVISYIHARVIHLSLDGGLLRESLKDQSVSNIALKVSYYEHRLSLCLLLFLLLFTALYLFKVKCSVIEKVGLLLATLICVCMMMVII